MTQSKPSEILVVDDDKHLLTTLKDYLTFKGYRVTTVSSGEAALAHLHAAIPDLIILDIGMPGMGGMGFLKRISEDTERSQIPILVLTAKAIMEKFFADLDIAGFIAKPCGEDDLLRKIREILSRSSVAKAIQPRVGGAVLLVEDDPRVRSEIVRSFEEGPHSITISTTDTAAEGIQRVVSLRPSLILANEVLRGMNGNEMAGLIRQMPGLHSIPILLYRKTMQAEGLWVFGHRLFGTREGYLRSTDSASLYDTACHILSSQVQDPATQTTLPEDRT